MFYLNLQRRHGRHCEAGHPVDLLTTEPEERKRGAKRCTCPIFASGTLDGRFRKLGTRRTDWDAAREAVAPYLESGSWTPDQSANSAPAVPTPAPGAPASITGAKTPKPPLPIEEAVERFLQQHRAERTADRTLKIYRLQLKGRADGKESQNPPLQRFALDKGLRHLQEFDGAGDGGDLVREMMAGWSTLRPGTRTNRLGTLKTFFEFFVETRHIEKNPARIRARRNRANRTGQDAEQEDGPRISYSDEELDRMFQGCKTYGKSKREWPKKRDGRQVVPISEFRDYARKWGGEDLAAFVEISVYTGLRIYDVATFHASRLQDDGTVRLRAQKNHSWVSVAVPESTARMIQDRARRFGPYIFGAPTGRKPDNITQTWRRRLEQLWEESGPWTHKPVHHKFRHTFVRMHLERGVGVALVARLIGDTEETVTKHYANWVPELQEATTQATRTAVLNRPRFSA